MQLLVFILRFYLNGLIKNMVVKLIIKKLSDNKLYHNHNLLNNYKDYDKYKLLNDNTIIEKKIYSINFFSYLNKFIQYFKNKLLWIFIVIFIFYIF